MRGKKRPTTERARAVGIAVVTGNVSEAARQTGLNESTVRQWVHSEEYAELRERNKDEVAAEWWAGVQAYQRAIMRHINSANLRDTVGAFMVMNQQLALLRGEATSRYEHRDLTGALDDHELATLKAIVQGGHPTEHPAEAAVVGAGQNGTTPA